MASHLTEEEQIEAFKRWWNENWVTIVLPLIVGVLLYVGWFWWQDHKEAQAQLASQKYQALETVLQSAVNGELTPEQKADVVSKANIVISEHAKTLYADMANLELASLHVEAGELEKAASAVNAVVQNATNKSMELLAKARLAKVYAAQGRYDEALALVAQGSDDSGDSAFTSLYAETRGDIYLALGDNAAANTAFNQAMDNLTQAASSRSGLLNMKISATAVAEDVPVSESVSVNEDVPGDVEENVAQEVEEAGETE